MNDLSQIEYAKARGWSASYVTKLKRQGRLVLTPAGKVNVNATDRLLENTRDPARGGDRRSTMTDDGVDTAPPALSLRDRTQQVGGTETYKEAARRERIAKARMAELDLAEASGQLVRREEVDRMMFGLSRQGLDALMSMSERLAGRCAAEHDEFRIAALIDAEARKIADQLARGSALLDATAVPVVAEDPA